MERKEMSTLMEQGFGQPTGWGQRATFINDDPDQHQIRLWQSRHGMTKVGCACGEEVGSLNSPDEKLAWLLYNTHLEASR